MNSLKNEEQESTFADLASEYSEGIESQLNGLIGPIEMGKINVKIAERLKISQRGHLWEPFQVDNCGYCLGLKSIYQVNRYLRKKELSMIFIISG